MGSAVSSLPEFLTEDDVKRVSGIRYNREKFYALKNTENVVSKQAFLDAVSSSQEQEVLDFFMVYCPKGEMDSRTFVKLLKDAKLLSKKDFTSVDADILYQKLIAQLLNTTKKLNYFHFRQDALPVVASRKGIPIEELLYKIARTEAVPQLNNVTQPDNVRLHNEQLANPPHQRRKSGTSISMFAPGAEDSSAVVSNPVGRKPSINERRGSEVGLPTVALPTTVSVISQRKPSVSAPILSPGSSTLPNIVRASFTADSVTSASIAAAAAAAASTTVDSIQDGKPRVSVLGELPSQSSDEQALSAVIKLQKVQRGVLARKESTNRMLIRNLSSKSITHEDFSMPTDSVEEGHLREVFLLNSTGGEMTSSQFINLMKAAKLITRKFSLADADLVFQKAKRKATLTMNDTLQNGVIHDKRITFQVFRVIALREVAERSGMTEMGMVKFLSHVSEPQIVRPEPTVGIAEVRERKSITEMTDLSGLMAVANAPAIGSVV